MKREKADILVIGAGPSGAIAAAVAEREGLQVRVIERAHFPRFVIGESLIPVVMEPLEELGLLDALSKQGYQKKFGARFIKGDRSCEFDFSEQFTPGWTWTWQMPRAEFDQCIVEQLINRGVDISFGQTVTDIRFDGSDSITRVSCEDGSAYEIEARFVIDASGYGRVLPRMLDLDEPSGLSHKSSLFVHAKDTNRPEGKEGTLITFVVLRTDVWMWVIPFSNGNVSIGFVGDPAFFDEHEGTHEEKLRAMIANVEHYADRFKNVSFVFEPKAISAYSVAVKQIYGDGFALTGNSAEFLDPIFSSGVAFSMKGGHLAATLASRQLKGVAVDWEREYQQYMCQGVDTFRSYVTSWYNGDLQDVFFNDKINMDFKRQICSVLAGYVWDRSNPFVKKHHNAIHNLARVLNIAAND